MTTGSVYCMADSGLSALLELDYLILTIILGIAFILV